MPAMTMSENFSSDTSQCRRPSFQALVDALDAACAGPTDDMQRCVGAALAAAAVDRELLAPQERAASAACYTRHVLHADPRGRYTLVSLVWQPGQFSPVHGHYTWCGYAVLEGDLQESAYRVGGGTGEHRLVASVDRRAGEAFFSHAGLEGAHRLGNAGRDVAISIHAYGIDAPRVATHVNRVLAPAVA